MNHPPKCCTQYRSILDIYCLVHWKHNHRSGLELDMNMEQLEDSVSGPKSLGKGAKRDKISKVVGGHPFIDSFT